MRAGQFEHNLFFTGGSIWNSITTGLVAIEEMFKIVIIWES